MQDFDGENMPKDWSTSSVANMQDFENEDMPQDWLTVCQLAPASHDSLPPNQPGARVVGESSSPVSNTHVLKPNLSLVPESSDGCSTKLALSAYAGAMMTVTTSCSICLFFLISMMSATQQSRMSTQTLPTFSLNPVLK